MAFSIEGKQVIKSLRKNKCYGVKNLLKVFPNKGWFLGHLSYAKELTVSNKSPCYERREHLLKRYPASLVNFIRFTDEKLFSVTLPTNTQMTACMLQSELWRKIFHHAVCCVPVQHSASQPISTWSHHCARCWSTYKINAQYYHDQMLNAWSAARNATVSPVHLSAGSSSTSWSMRNCGHVVERRQTLSLQSPSLWPLNSQISIA